MTTAERTPRIGFSAWHALLALAAFVLEVLIATRVPHASWIRGYFGDVLVVVLLYAAVRSVLRVNDFALLLAVFVFACGIEFAQYFGVAERLGFVRDDVMYTVIGNTFSWGDVACYALGCGLTALVLVMRDVVVSARRSAAR
jgi:hypothetical protein